VTNPGLWGQGTIEVYCHGLLWLGIEGHGGSGVVVRICNENRLPLHNALFITGCNGICVLHHLVVK